MVTVTVHRMSSTRKTTTAASPTIITSRQFIPWLVNGSLPSAFSLDTDFKQSCVREDLFPAHCCPIASLEQPLDRCGVDSNLSPEWNSTNAYLEPAEVEAMYGQD
jgi:hypothetical protein